VGFPHYILYPNNPLTFSLNLFRRLSVIDTGEKMAHFYEKKGDREASWEEVGGFNSHLLTELRNAMLSVEDGDKPAGPVQAVVAEWIRRLPAFDFPDDEIG
jgi:hypothetical protein